MPGVSRLLDAIRPIRDVEMAGAVLGSPALRQGGDSLLTLFGYGIEPEAQGLYQVPVGADLTPGDTGGVLLECRPRPRCCVRRRATRSTWRGRLDPQALARTPGRTAGGSRHRPLAVRLRGGRLRSAPSSQSCSGWRASTGDDRASVIVVKARSDGAVGSVAQRLRDRYPRS